MGAAGGLIAPHDPQGKRGCPPTGIERMLSVYFLQQWHGLADGVPEDVLYDSHALRTFAWMDPGSEARCPARRGC